MQIIVTVASSHWQREGPRPWLDVITVCLLVGENQGKAADGESRYPTGHMARPEKNQFKVNRSRWANQLCGSLPNLIGEKRWLKEIQHGGFQGLTIWQRQTDRGIRNGKFACMTRTKIPRICKSFGQDVIGKARKTPSL